MERKYLVAALAIIGTFAVFSHGLKSLARYSVSSGERMEAAMGAKCAAKSSVASAWAHKVRTHLRPGFAEEAQMLAEMNLPLAMAQIKMEETARQTAAAECARATAMRNAERAQREAMRMQQRIDRFPGSGKLEPLSGGQDMREQVRSAMRDSMTARNDAMKQATDQVQQAFGTFNTSELTAGDFANKQNFGESKLSKQCTLTLREQAERMALNATRTVVRQVEHYVGSM